MAKRQITNEAFRSILDDLERITKQSPALLMLNRAKIDRFLSDNAMQVRIVNERTLTMQKQYCVFDADGKPVYELKDGINYFTYHNDLDKEKHTKAYNSFMSQKVQIEMP